MRCGLYDLTGRKKIKLYLINFLKNEKKIKKISYFYSEEQISYFCKKNNFCLIDFFEIKKVSESKKDKIILTFLETLSQYLSCGIGLKESLNFMENDNSISTEISCLCNEINRHLNKGEKFSATLQKMQDFFPESFLNFIENADETGNLTELLEQIKFFFQKKIHTKEKIKNALIYPAIIFVLAIVLVFTMIFFIFPKFELLFSGFGKENLEKINSLIKNFKIKMLFLVATSLLVFFGILFLKTVFGRNEKIKLFFDKIFLRNKYLMRIISYLNFYKFSYSMEILLKSGISFDRAILKSSKMLNNLCLREEMKKCRKEIKNGESLYKSFSSKVFFLKDLLSWIYIGEKTGKTPSSFMQIRKFCENKIESLLLKLSILIEPLVIILCGIFILLICMELIIPIFNLYGNLV